MRRPQDPLHHGLKIPSKVHSKIGRIEIDYSTQGGAYVIRLKAVVDAWHKVLGDHLSQGHRIVGEPSFVKVCGDYNLTLEYMYEWDNLGYEAEKIGYDATLAAYQEQLAAFLKWEDELDKSPPDLDKKIERARERLANLEATKAGQPLPFP